MNRRDFLKINAGSVAASLVYQPSVLAAKQSDDSPNLLVIMTDEHNFRTLGCYRKLLSKDQAMIWGDGNIVETPHIDKLAEEGVLCNNFYASSPVCSPARGSFISGQYPQNTPVIDNNTHMSDDVVSFGSILQCPCGKPQASGYGAFRFPHASVCATLPALPLPGIQPQCLCRSHSR